MGVSQYFHTNNINIYFRCDGTWGLAILNKADPSEIVVACNGSPMVIGLAQGEIFVASETAAFNRYTKNFIAMKVQKAKSKHYYVVLTYSAWYMVQQYSTLCGRSTHGILFAE